MGESGLTGVLFRQAAAGGKALLSSPLLVAIRMVNRYGSRMLGQSPERLTSLPNMLTASRIVAAPVLAASVLEFHAPYAEAALVAIAGLTDAFDGAVARATGQTSRLGEALDPIADKIFVVTGFVLLFAEHTISGAGVWAVLIILWRELLISGLRDQGRSLGFHAPVSAFAKAKTIAQFLCLILLFLSRPEPNHQGLLWTVGTDLLWIAAALTLYSGADYMFRAWRTSWK